MDELNDARLKHRLTILVNDELWNDVIRAHESTGASMGYIVRKVLADHFSSQDRASS
jgi:hypothetical protein